jgi:hypothetical protein
MDFVFWLLETLGWSAIKAWWASRHKDPMEAAYEAKEREAKVMEAPDRPESVVDADLLRHAGNDNQRQP